jgi:protein-S-isoprenylcysteine O-methyltransferase Ste14
MQRILVFIYGVISYVLFLGVFLYAIGFIGNFGLSKTLDSAPEVPFAQAMMVNIGLLAVFAVQHSLMARSFFKRWITRFIPRAAERSTYVLASNLALILLFWLWEPMGGAIWQVDSQAGIALIYTLYALGWLLVLYATFVINHFDLFGLRQAWYHLRQQPYTAVPFVNPWLYRIVRHPLYVGWLLVFWSTPSMTVAHLLFAIMTTAYILVAIQLEERDLVEAHPEYAEYRLQVPMILPFMGKRRQPSGGAKPA